MSGSCSLCSPSELAQRGELVDTNKPEISNRRKKKKKWKDSIPKRRILEQSLDLSSVCEIPRSLNTMFSSPMESTTVGILSRKYFPELVMDFLTDDVSLVEMSSGTVCFSGLSNTVLGFQKSEFNRVVDSTASSSTNSWYSSSTSGGEGEDGVEDRTSGRRKTTWGDMPKFLLAGAASTIVSRTFVAPLERIKLECITRGSKVTSTQVIRTICVSEGLGGFWKGNTLNLFRMVPFKSINFICYDMYCDFIISLSSKNQISNNDRLIGGAIAGVLATVLCIPLDTIRTRMIAPGGEVFGGVRGCFHHIVKKEGFFSLYRGLAPALLGMGPANAVFYAVYDMLKTSYLSNRRLKHSDAELGVVRTLIYGATAGACAESLTYPLEVIRRQIQLQQFGRVGIGMALAKSIEANGVGSLFAGFVPSTLQVLPSAALSYLFYEMMKSILKIN